MLLSKAEFKDCLSVEMIGWAEVLYSELLTVLRCELKSLTNSDWKKLMLKSFTESLHLVQHVSSPCLNN